MKRRIALRDLLVVLACVGVVVAGVLSFAVHDAKRRILQALGPRATVGEIDLHYPVVTLRDVRVAADPAPGAWPAPDEFRAARVAVRIDAASLWAFRRGEPLRIANLEVADGVLVMLRTRGHLTILPALRETTHTPAGAPAPVSSTGWLPAAEAAPVEGKAPPPDFPLVVQAAHVDNLAIDLFDATLPGAAMHHLRFEQVHGDARGVALPALAEPVTIDVAGRLKGVERDGTMTLKGSFTPASHDARLALALTDGDMIVLAPYLLRHGEGGVRHGRLDLRLDGRVAGRQLEAPGHLTLTGLEFDDTDTQGRETIRGAGRRAALAVLSRDGRIDLDFRLEGRTDDPKFSLDEGLSTRLAAGFAEAVGVSVKGVAVGVGGVFKGLLGGKPRSQ